MKSYLDALNEEKKESHDDNLSSVMSSSALSFIETEHARMRRQQRCIDKKDLKMAKKHGTCEPHYWKSKNGDQRRTATDIVRYTYKDIVYIVNKATKKEVTCYARPMKLDRVPISREMEINYQEATLKIRSDLDCWTSNTVIVVDTSGSMRTSDIWGARDRLKSVWFCVALDYIAERLESGNASYTDVVSVIMMGDEPVILFKDIPTSWILYNKIVKLYNSYQIQAEGDGNYLPSLASAEELLNRNSNASCAAALIFLSDGAPSDRSGGREKIPETVESLAKTFGRRLTFTAIGIGDSKEFTVLKSMVDVAKEYDCTSELKLPSMSSSSLGQIFSTVASSLTQVQTEMTDIGTLKQRKVRNVVRESKSKANQDVTEVTDEDFWFYPKDRVTRKIYHERLNDDGQNEIYYTDDTLQHPDASYVALAKGPFGEGAERYAFRFYEIAADKRTILGAPLVAKESRMILDVQEGKSTTQTREDFAKNFDRTQKIAGRLAIKFNNKLKSIRRIHKDTPTVSFLDCSIYELYDKKNGISSVLVEKKLDHTKWYKWNSNNGYVDGVKKLCGSDDETLLQFHNMGINDLDQGLTNFDLNIIDEDDEEDETDDDDDGKDAKFCAILFTHHHVAQAFSHYSYLQSNRRRLVCDLQGVFDEKNNMLVFSDPAIHYYNPQRQDKRRIHGGTDRGRAGMKEFFQTHNCNEEQGLLCRLMTRGFRPIKSRG